MLAARLIGFAVLSVLFISPVLAIDKAAGNTPIQKAAAKAPAEKAPDVDAALTEWKNAVEARQLGPILRLYDRNAIMISTFAQEPIIKRAELAGYYKKVIANPDVKVEIVDTHPRIFGDMAVNTGRYTLSYTQEGEPVTIPARFSFVYKLEDGKWRIVDHHSSRVPMPENEPVKQSEKKK